MSITSAYSGVHVEKLPGGAHPINGVATSVAAFIGWANKGPTNQAALVESFSDFQNQFGGFTSNNGAPNYLGYAINQFFANGGQQACIVRLVWDGSLKPSPCSSSPMTPSASASGTLLLPPATPPSGTFASVGSADLASNSPAALMISVWAANPGQWGNNLQVSVTSPTDNPSRFGIEVSEVQSNGSLQIMETFTNLSSEASDPQYLVTVINNDSDYITFNSAKPTTASGTLTATVSLTNGADGSVLNPGTDGNFELALGPDTSPTSINNFGLRLLDRVNIFNLLCVPGETDAATIQCLQEYCNRKRAFCIIDCPQVATAQLLAANGPYGTTMGAPNLTNSNLTGAYSSNSAYYYPWVLASDPLHGNLPVAFPPCGFLAGIYAATDASRGVWKAPAGVGAALTGATGLQFTLTDSENGVLNTQAVNCLRAFEVYGDVAWGDRTLAGSDEAGSQWKYIPIRRLALYIESSLYAGTQWMVFEPNNETLWGQIRLNVGSFMQGLFLQGAFQGASPQQAYFVKCDSENNPQSSIDQGVVNISVGFAPLYPAEFVVIQIQQMAGQSQPQSRSNVMATFPANPTRLDPYKNFKFRLKWDDKYVAGFSKVSGIERITEVVEHREGGDPSTSPKSPGRNKYEAITLEHGLTQDLNFYKWAGSEGNSGAIPGFVVLQADSRKDIYLEFYDEARQLVIAYKIYRCWVSECRGTPNLDPNANAIALEHIKLENEGWERDTSVTEPQGPMPPTVST